MTNVGLGNYTSRTVGLCSWKQELWKKKERRGERKEKSEKGRDGKREKRKGEKRKEERGGEGRGREDRRDDCLLRNYLKPIGPVLVLIPSAVLLTTAIFQLIFSPRFLWLFFASDISCKFYMVSVSTCLPKTLFSFLDEVFLYHPCLASDLSPTPVLTQPSPLGIEGYNDFTPIYSPMQEILDCVIRMALLAPETKFQEHNTIRIYFLGTQPDNAGIPGQATLPQVQWCWDPGSFHLVALPSLTHLPPLLCLSALSRGKERIMEGCA